MKWSEPKPPTEGKCYYDYVEINTPLGLVRIEWKSWKENPSYDIEINNEWIGCVYSLDEAKLVAEKYLKTKSEQLNSFLNTLKTNTDETN